MILNRHTGWKPNILGSSPEHGRTVFILVESDTTNDYDSSPKVYCAVLKRTKTEPIIDYWELLDYDSDYEEPILRQDRTVVLWRYYHVKR